MNKKILLIIVAVIIFALVILIILFNTVFNSQPELPEESISPSPTINNSSLSVIRTFPNHNSLLTPNTAQNFIIDFNRPVNQSLISMGVVKTEYSNNIYRLALPFSVEYHNDGKKVVIKLNELIRPYSRYEVIIKDKILGNDLVHNTYQTQDHSLAPTIAQNNQDLKQYLPYETRNFRLAYAPAQNVYVFNYIFDIQDTREYSVMYESAKEDVRNFIRSKGIDPNSVIIDWGEN